MEMLTPREHKMQTRSSEIRSSAFSSSFRSLLDHVYLDPPKLSKVAYLTGGLKLLHYRIDQAEGKKVHDGVRSRQDGEKYCPVPGTVLAQRYQTMAPMSQSGQSAVLFRAQDLFRGGREVVIKAMHCSYYALAVQEAHCLRCLRHADPLRTSKIVQLLNTFVVDKHFCMVFEALTPHPITDALPPVTLETRDQTISNIRTVAMQLIQVLGFLRQQHYIHADLKPDNIVLEREGDLSSVKVIDFGNAIRRAFKEIFLYYKDFNIQPLLYRAPEAMFGLCFDSEIDMWSLGCILAELYLGKSLFHGSSKLEILQSMTRVLGPIPKDPYLKGKFFDSLKNFTGNTVQKDATYMLLQMLPHCTDFPFANFLARLLRYCPEERLTPMQAARHPFLARAFGLHFLLPPSESLPDQTRLTLTPHQYTHRPTVDADLLYRRSTSTDLLHSGTGASSMSMSAGKDCWSNTALSEGKSCPVSCVCAEGSWSNTCWSRQEGSLKTRLHGGQFQTRIVVSATAQVEPVTEILPCEPPYSSPALESRNLHSATCLPRHEQHCSALSDSLEELSRSVYKRRKADSKSDLSQCGTRETPDVSSITGVARNGFSACDGKPCDTKEKLGFSSNTGMSMDEFLDEDLSLADMISGRLTERCSSDATGLSAPESGGVLGSGRRLTQCAMEFHPRQTPDAKGSVAFMEESELHHGSAKSVSLCLHGKSTTSGDNKINRGVEEKILKNCNKSSKSSRRTFISDDGVQGQSKAEHARQTLVRNHTLPSSHFHKKQRRSDSTEEQTQGTTHQDVKRDVTPQRGVQSSSVQSGSVQSDSVQSGSSDHCASSQISPQTSPHSTGQTWTQDLSPAGSCISFRRQRSNVQHHISREQNLNHREEGKRKLCFSPSNVDCKHKRKQEKHFPPSFKVVNAPTSHEDNPKDHTRHGTQNVAKDHTTCDMQDMINHARHSMQNVANDHIRDAMQEMAEDHTRHDVLDTMKDHSGHDVRNMTKDHTRDDVQNMTKGHTRSGMQDVTKDHTRDDVQNVTKSHTRSGVQDVTKGHTRDDLQNMASTATGAETGRSVTQERNTPVSNESTQHSTGMNPGKLMTGVEEDSDGEYVDLLHDTIEVDKIGHVKKLEKDVSPEALPKYSLHFLSCQQESMSGTRQVQEDGVEESLRKRSRAGKRRVSGGGETSLSDTASSHDEELTSAEREPDVEVARGDCDYQLQMKSKSCISISKMNRNEDISSPTADRRITAPLEKEFVKESAKNVSVSGKWTSDNPALARQSDSGPRWTKTWHGGVKTSSSSITEGRVQREATGSVQLPGSLEDTCCGDRWLSWKRGALSDAGRAHAKCLKVAQSKPTPSEAHHLSPQADSAEFPVLEQSRSQNHSSTPPTRDSHAACKSRNHQDEISPFTVRQIQPPIERRGADYLQSGNGKKTSSGDWQHIKGTKRNPKTLHRAYKRIFQQSDSSVVCRTNRFQTTHRSASTCHSLPHTPAAGSELMLGEHSAFVPKQKSDGDIDCFDRMLSHNSKGQSDNRVGSCDRMLSHNDKGKSDSHVGSCDRMLSHNDKGKSDCHVGSCDRMLSHSSVGRSENVQDETEVPASSLCGFEDEETESCSQLGKVHSTLDTCPKKEIEFCHYGNHSRIHTSELHQKRLDVAHSGISHSLNSSSQNSAMPTSTKMDGSLQTSDRTFQLCETSLGKPGVLGSRRKHRRLSQCPRSQSCAMSDGEEGDAEPGAKAAVSDGGARLHRRMPAHLQLAPSSRRLQSRSQPAAVWQSARMVEPPASAMSAAQRMILPERAGAQSAETRLRPLGQISYDEASEGDDDEVLLLTEDI